MSKMLKSSGAIALATLISRLLGMVREIVYYGFMGVGWVNDSFQLAFTIPNLFRRLLGEGALTAAFIPIFKEKEKLHGEAEMWRASNAVISGLVVSASVIIAIVLLAVSGALWWHTWDEKTELMLRLLRVMFPYMLLVCLTAGFMGMLNARGHFFIPALGAAMLNVVMISSVLWLAPRFATDLPPDDRLQHQIFALAIGILCAGVAQAGFQLPTLYRDGFRIRWVAPWHDETVRRVIYRMVPGAIGVAAFQINVTMVQLLGFHFGDGIVSSFNGAVRLMELPQGMFGISIATYLLPTLSALATDKNYDEFRKTLCNGIGTVIFLNLIAAILLVVLATPIIRLLFQHGAFNQNATRNVSWALMCLAPGLVFFSTVNILARAFYALGDTKTPMQISMFCLMLNLVFAVLLIGRYKQGGLGIANTITSICNMSLLIFALRKKLRKLEMQSLRATILPLIIAGALAGVTAWFGWQLWEQHLGHPNLAMRVGAVFGPAVAAGLVYWVVGIVAKVPAANEIVGFVFAKFLKRPKVVVGETG
jgi:putative peptidoglycan lipid II flippase